MLQLRIKEICKEQGITLNTLAERIGVTQPSISGLATGKIKPSLDTLEKLSKALDVEVGELFTPKNDFIAFIRSKGKTHTFTSLEDLREYVITSEGLYLCCNESATSPKMCQNEAQETKGEESETANK